MHHNRCMLCSIALNTGLTLAFYELSKKFKLLFADKSFVCNEFIEWENATKLIFPSNVRVARLDALSWWVKLQTEDHTKQFNCIVRTSIYAGFNENISINKKKTIQAFFFIIKTHISTETWFQLLGADFIISLVFETNFQSKNSEKNALKKLQNKAKHFVSQKLSKEKNRHSFRSARKFKLRKMWIKKSMCVNFINCVTLNFEFACWNTKSKKNNWKVKIVFKNL